MTTMFVARRAPAPTRVLVVAAFLRLTTIHMAAMAVAWIAIPVLFLGADAAVITSGSMQPSIRPGDIVLTTEADLDALEPGRIVKFDHGDGATTHRIATINEDGTYTTRGDANHNDDSTPVTGDIIQGTVRAVVPTVGLPILWAQQQQWHLLAGLLLFAMLIIASPSAGTTPDTPPRAEPEAAAAPPAPRRDRDRGTWARAAVIVPVAVGVVAMAAQPAAAALTDAYSQTASWGSDKLGPASNPTTTTDCTTAAVTEPTVTVDWTAAPAPADSYDLYRIQDGTTTLIATPTATNYSDKVANGTTVTYRVIARLSSWSSTHVDSAAVTVTC